MKQNIIFFGSGSYTIPIVKKLSQHNLKLVITTEKDPTSHKASRGRVGELVKFCESNQINFISTHLKDKKTIEIIKNTQPTVAVLASYGAYIPEKVIKSIPNGIINIHPSLLPKWKGPSPIQYTLLNGDTQAGVTLIKLDNEIDHGPILSQETLSLSGHETTKDLLDILFSRGADMVGKLIIRLENGETLKKSPQNHRNETWSFKIEKKDGMINIDNPPSSNKLNNMIRAYYPWPTVWFVTRIKNKESRVKLLPEDRIQVEGKSPMGYKDFVNGFGEEGKEILEKLNLH